MSVIDQKQREILIIDLPEMKVAAYRVVNAYPEIEANSFLRAATKKANLSFHKLRKFGMDIPVSDAEQKAGLRGYEAWACIPNEILSLDGVEIKIIPAGYYASCKITNPSKSTFDNISNGWIELHNWVKKSTYKSCFNNPNRYMIEEYGRFNGKLYLQLYYPVSN